MISVSGCSPDPEFRRLNLGSYVSDREAVVCGDDLKQLIAVMSQERDKALALFAFWDAFCLGQCVDSEAILRGFESSGSLASFFRWLADNLGLVVDAGESVASFLSRRVREVADSLDPLNPVLFSDN